jgi:hypothetical protein
VLAGEGVRGQILGMGHGYEAAEARGKPGRIADVVGMAVRGE